MWMCGNRRARGHRAAGAHGCWVEVAVGGRVYCAGNVGKVVVSVLATVVMMSILNDLPGKRATRAVWRSDREYRLCDVIIPMLLQGVLKERK